MCFLSYSGRLKRDEFPQPELPDDYNLGDVFPGLQSIFWQCKENDDYDILTGLVEVSPSYSLPRSGSIDIPVYTNFSFLGGLASVDKQTGKGWVLTRH